jgi:putative ABC transport system permease protein
MAGTLLIALRSLRARSSRTVLTTFGAVLGVAVILSIRITNRSTIESITAVFNEASGKAHLVVARSSTSDQGFPESALRRVENVAGVEAAIPSLHARTLLVNEGDGASSSQLDISFFGVAAGGLLLYGVDPSLDPRAREYTIVAGRFLPPDLDAYEVVLVEDYADDEQIQVGDDVQILTPERVETLRVVGLMSKEGPGRLNNGAFGIIPLETAQWIFGRTGDLDQIDIVAVPEATSSASLDSLKVKLQARLDDSYAVTYPAARGRRVTQMIDGYQIGLSFFSLIALFVGTFLIYNAFSMTVVERTREIGMLRTVGMTQRQVVAQVLAQAAVLGIVGSTLGVGMGLLLSKGLIRGMELLLAQEVSQVSVTLGDLSTSVLVGLSATLVAAMIPAWQASRISPLEAVRIRGRSSEGWIIRRGWTVGAALVILSYLIQYHVRLPSTVEESLGHLVPLGLLLGGTLLIPISVGAWERLARPWVRRIYGSEAQLGTRNARRAKSRTTLTVAALMVGVAMILSIRAVASAFEDDLRTWLENYIGGDLYVHSSLEMRAELGRRIEAIEGIAAVAPIRYFEVKRLKPDGGNEELSFMAVEPSAYRRVTSFVFAANQGQPDRLLDRLERGGAVFVSSVLSEKYGLGQGDTVRLRTRRGEMDFEVAAVVVDFYNRGMVVQGSWRDMRHHFKLNDVSAFLVKVQPGYDVDSIRDRIDHLYGKRYHLTIESNETLSTQAFGLLAQTSSLFDVLALIAMIVAALGVINTLTMNVLERTQEIGMLRSLGMTRGQVAKMILAESGMMGLIGGAFGLIFGVLLSRAVLSNINAATGYELNYVLPAQSVVVSVIISLVVSQLAAIWPARRAVGINIIEAIQVE